MKDTLETLIKCVLFKGLTMEEIVKLLGGISINLNAFAKNEVIAIENSKCTSLGIIIKGKVEIQKIFPSGKIITLNTFNTGNIFGEALVFSGENVYPSTIMSIDETKILFVHKNDIIDLCKKNDIFLNNFMTVLSDRILMLSGRIRNLSYETIRKKLAIMLLDEYKKQKNLFLTFQCTRKKMAEILDVPRPSLSRELINMRDDGIIDFDKNVIKIINLNLLEECLID